MSALSFFRASFYARNLPVWERILRVVVALAAAVLAPALLPAPTRWLGVGAAVAFALSGLFGFCPMCALAGRRLANKP